jgi:hypothetical protein
MSEELIVEEIVEDYGVWENAQTESVANYLTLDALGSNLRHRCGSYKEFVFEANKFSLYETPDGVSFNDANVKYTVLESQLWDS